MRISSNGIERGSAPFRAHLRRTTDHRVRRRIVGCSIDRSRRRGVSHYAHGRQTRTLLWHGRMRRMPRARERRAGAAPAWNRPLPDWQLNRAAPRASESQPLPSPPRDPTGAKLDGRRPRRRRRSCRIGCCARGCGSRPRRAGRRRAPQARRPVLQATGGRLPRSTSQRSTSSSRKACGCCVLPAIAARRSCPARQSGAHSRPTPSRQSSADARNSSARSGSFSPPAHTNAQFRCLAGPRRA